MFTFDSVLPCFFVFTYLFTYYSFFFTSFSILLFYLYSFFFTSFSILLFYLFSFFFTSFSIPSFYLYSFFFTSFSIPSFYLYSFLFTSFSIPSKINISLHPPQIWRTALVGLSRNRRSRSSGWKRRSQPHLHLRPRMTWEYHFHHNRYHFIINQYNSIKTNTILSKPIQFHQTNTLISKSIHFYHNKYFNPLIYLIFFSFWPLVDLIFTFCCT